MIKIKYEIYCDDFSRKPHQTKCFADLDSMYDWILQNYYHTSDSNSARIGFYSDRISFKSKTLNCFTGYRWASIWIHLIENDEGIIYSNGEYTYRQRHISEALNKRFEIWRKEVADYAALINKKNCNFVK